MDDVLSRLRARNGERFLFSGDATATRPFGTADELLDDVRAIAAAATDETDFAAQLDANIDDPAGGFQTSFYRGAQTASDPDSVLGNQSAFADLLRGLSVMALSHTAQTVPFTDADSPALTTALERLERGRTELVNIQANVHRG